MEWREDAKGSQTSTVIDTVILPADDVILAIGQENAFPWIERDIGIEFDKWRHAGRRQVDDAVDPPGRVLRRRRRLGPKNIIWAVAHAHEAAISIHNHCQGSRSRERPRAG